MDLLGACDQIKSLAGNVEGVKVAAIGLNEAWPNTPAVEVVPVGFDLATIAAGDLDQELDGFIFLAVYVAMTKNLEADERTLLPIVERLLQALRDPNLDRTLGGRVEDLRPTRVDFDVVKRNNRSYRSAVIQVAIGDLATSV